MTSLVNFILWFIISYVFFIFKDLSEYDYLTLAVCICGGLLAWYYKSINARFQQHILTGLAGSIAAYVWKFGCQDFMGILPQQYHSIEVNSTPFLIVVLLVAIVVFCEKHFCRASNPKTDDENCSDKEIFEERLDDCRRLTKLIENFDAVGIDAPWGAGKTFLVNYFCNTEAVRKSYKVIRIEALSYNYEEYDKLVLGEIDAALNEHHIFSHNYMKIKNVITGSTITMFLYKAFFGWDADTVSNLEAVKNKVDSLDKKFLIVFEDIDRAEKEAICKIFSIGERLAGKNIKIIYEFEGHLLDEKGFDREFRNKYVQADMHLTSLGYDKLIKVCWKQLHMDQVQLDNKKIDLRAELHNAVHYDDSRFVLNGEQYKYSTGFNIYPIRWIKNFLRELKSYLDQYHDVSLLELRVAIRMFFIKNTNFDLFDKFYGPEKLDVLFKFKDSDEEMVDLHQLTARKLDIERELRKARNSRAEKDLNQAEKNKKKYDNIINREENKDSRYIFSLFSEYRFEELVRLESDDKAGLGEGEWEEDQLYRVVLREKETNEHINRVIWNILEGGKSHLTDNGAMTKRFVNEILNMPFKEPGELRDRFNKIFADYWDGSGYKDNVSTQMVGEDFLFAIARSLYYRRVSGQTWRKFINVYPILSRGNDLDENFVKICDFIDLNEYETLIETMKLFNQQYIVDNLSRNAEYINFLSNAMQKVVLYGLYDDPHLLIFENCAESYDLMKNPEEVRKTLKAALSTFKMKFDISSESISARLTCFMNSYKKTLTFIIPKKQGGLKAVLLSQSRLNLALQKIKMRMITL